MNRKAIAGWVIGLIILVLTFVILLFLYKAFSWESSIDENVCRQSLIMRASSPEIAKKDLVELPVKCQTRKICIANSFFAQIPVIGGCSEFKGEKNVKIEKIDSEEEAKQVIAEEMYTCWWQFYLQENNPYDRRNFKDQTICALCSRIAFDDAARKNWPEIYGLGEYLKKTKIPNSEKTYTQYFFGGLKNLATGDVKQEKPIDTSKQYAINYDVREKSLTSYLVTGIAGCIVSAVGTVAISSVPVVGWVIGPTVGLGIFAAGCIASNDIANEIDTQLGEDKFTVSMNLREYNSKDLVYCSKIVTLP